MTILYNLTRYCCFFQGSNVLACLCGWLLSVMDESEYSKVTEELGVYPWRYNMAALDRLIDVFVNNKWGSLLVTGFDIFQQVSLLAACQ